MDGLGGGLDDAFVVVAGHLGDLAGRLVDEVEADLSGGNPFVSLGEGLPVEAESVERGLVLPEVEGLGALGIDAIAGAAVESDVDVDLVLAAQLHGAVDLREAGLGELVDIVVLDPERVAQR